MTLRIGSVELGRRPVIVAAGGEAELKALAAAGGADLVELRADLFAVPTPDAIAAALERLRLAGRPIILTARASSEGGRDMPEARRHAIFERCLSLADAVDVEIASTELAATVVPAARSAGVLVLLSTHDFATTPPRAELLARIERAFAAGADCAKVATQASSLAALQTLLDVTRAAPGPIVTLAMGAMGPLSRFVLSAAGSLLTYASIGAPTAPGQMPVAELAALVRRFFPI